MVSFIDDDQRTVDYFTARVERYGDSVEALDWSSRATQAKRFEVLSDIVLSSGNSVLDVGCGQGDFYAWLKASGIEPNYAGIDLTPAMIEMARQRFPAARFEIRTAADILDLGTWDYIIASGLFYLRKHQPFAYLCATVTGLFAQCRNGLAFNCLSSSLKTVEDGEYRESPARVFEFCRTLTPLVSLHHDYHPGDFTMHLRRGKPTA
jgi:SAM-dependent methyltransferase